MIIGLAIDLRELDTIILQCLFTAASGGYNSKNQSASIDFPLNRSSPTFDSDSNGTNIDVEAPQDIPQLAKCEISPIIYATVASIIRELITDYFYGINEKVRPRKFLDLFIN